MLWFFGSDVSAACFFVSGVSAGIPRRKKRGASWFMMHVCRFSLSWRRGANSFGHHFPAYLTGIYRISIGYLYGIYTFYSPKGIRESIGMYRHLYKPMKIWINWFRVSMGIYRYPSRCTPLYMDTFGYLSGARRTKAQRRAPFHFQSFCHPEESGLEGLTSTYSFNGAFWSSMSAQPRQTEGVTAVASWCCSGVSALVYCC